MAQADNAVDLLDWFIVNGGKVHASVRIHDLGLRGRGILVHDSAIAEGTTILSVPMDSKCLLQADNAYLSPVYEVVLEDEYSDWWTLTLLVLQECTEDSSRWRHLFYGAPKSYTSALYWTDRDMEALHCAGESWLKEQVVEEQLKTQQEYEGVKKLVFDCYSEKNYFPEACQSFATFIWMRSFLKTRGVDFDVGDESISVVLPIVDMLNHSSVESEVNAKVTLDLECGEFQVIAKKAIAAGEEILICYDQDANNAEMLRRYGFLPEKNPNTHVALPCLKSLAGCESCSSADLWVSSDARLSATIIATLGSFQESDIYRLYSEVVSLVQGYLDSWSYTMDCHRKIAEDESGSYVKRCIASVFVSDHVVLTAFIRNVSAMLECDLRGLCRLATAQRFLGA